MSQGVNSSHYVQIVSVEGEKDLFIQDGAYLQRVRDCHCGAPATWTAKDRQINDGFHFYCDNDVEQARRLKYMHKFQRLASPDDGS